MNREEGVVKGRVEEEEVKRSKAPVEEAEFAPELNPFLVEPVLVRLLKLVESVSQLKELRKMCKTWDEFNLKELEDRAFNGKIEAIDLFRRYHSRSEAEASLVQFMGDTLAIPRLFCSFRFNFPHSWIIFTNHIDFFSVYPVTFVHLYLVKYFPEPEQFGESLTKFMESDIWGNFKEITIGVHLPSMEYGDFGDYDNEDFELPSGSIFVPAGNMERKLQKLDIKPCTPQILEIFKSAFASGNYTNLSTMRFDELPEAYGKLDFPGFDASKLTRLEVGMIDEMENGIPNPSLNQRFTSGLLNWARNGMTLKNFAMSMDTYIMMMEDPDQFFEHIRLICSNLSQFLSSQSSTLEVLTFHFSCDLEDPIHIPEGAENWCKIHLPIFDVLHTLKLWVGYKLIEANSRRTHTKLFGMNKNLTVHFPKLVNLTLRCECSLDALKVNPATDEAVQLQLKRLEISDIHNLWSTSFVGVVGSVEELKCPIEFLCGEILPWGESLRSLYIHYYKYKYYTVTELKSARLNYFKKLDKLVTNFMYEFRDEITVVNGCGGLQMKVDDYLATFKGATELPLTSITFVVSRTEAMTEKTKGEFIKYFPFPVIFKPKIYKFKWCRYA